MTVCENRSQMLRQEQSNQADSVLEYIEHLDDIQLQLQFQLQLQDQLQASEQVGIFRFWELFRTLFLVWQKCFHASGTQADRVTGIAVLIINLWQLCAGTAGQPEGQVGSVWAGGVRPNTEMDNKHDQCRVRSLNNMPRFGSLSSGKRAKSLGAKTHQRSVSDSSLREVVQECRVEDTREYSNSDTEVTTTDTEPTILYRDWLNVYKNIK